MSFTTTAPYHFNPPTPPAMISYQYFVYDQGSYLLKSKKTGVIILGGFFVLFGVLFFTLIFKSPIGAILGGSAFFLFGFFCITAAFTKVIFNRTAQTIERTGTLASHIFPDEHRLESIRNNVILPIPFKKQGYFPQ